MASKSVEIPDIGVVVLSKRRGNSNIRLSFGRDGSVRVSIPYWLPYQAGVEFAKTRRDWIARHRPSGKPLLQEGDRIGKAHHLHFVADAVCVKPTVRLSSQQIVVTHPMTSLLTSPAVQGAAERGALRALKKQADQLLPGRLAILAKQHNFTYKSVATKRLSSRWGSCSNAHDITLNIFLMQLSWQLIDYVLVHELVHTEHLNHSAEFWRRFEHALPGAKKIRRELKTHQTMITPQS